MSPSNTSVPPSLDDFKGDVLTVREAASVLGIGHNLAYRQVAEGTIPAVRLGSRWVIGKDALRRLLEK